MRLCLNHNNFFGPCLGYEWLSNAKNYSNIFQLLHIMSDMLFHVFQIFGHLLCPIQCAMHALIYHMTCTMLRRSAYFISNRISELVVTEK